MGSVWLYCALIFPPPSKASIRNVKLPFCFQRSGPFTVFPSPFMQQYEPANQSRVRGLHNSFDSIHAPPDDEVTGLLKLAHVRGNVMRILIANLGSKLGGQECRP